MFRASWTIGRTRGIPIRLHISLLLIIPFVAFTISTRDLPMLAQVFGFQSADLLLPLPVWGCLLSVAIFGGVVAHELGHALTALALGGRVRAITLMVLGGVTEIDHPEATPHQQFWTALAGPLVSLALALASLVAAMLPWFGLDLKLALTFFSFVNFVLTVFNLVPAYPLDGGRILRALLASRMPPDRATRIAALVGRTLATAAAVWAVSSGNPPLLLIAAFIYFGAGIEASAVALRMSLEGLTAAQAMAVRVATVDPHRLSAAIAHHMLLQDAQCAIVRDFDRTYGVLVPSDLRRSELSAGEIVRGDAVFVRFDDDLGQVAGKLQRAGASGAIVRDMFNTVIGVVTHAELARAASLRVAAGQLAGLPTADGTSYEQNRP